MKIVTKNKVYVQLNDIAILYTSDFPIPAFIVKKTADKTLIISEQNRFDFIEFTEPEEINYFKKQDWIIDYLKFKDKTDEEFREIDHELTKEYNKLVRKYNSSLLQSTKKQEILTKCHLLQLKANSFSDLLLFKNGFIDIKLPEEIINQTQSKNKDSKIKSLIKKNKK